MWQLPQQPLTIKQVIAHSYELFKAAFGRQHVILTMFFVLLAIPNILAPYVNITWGDLAKSHRVPEAAILFFLYVLAVFWIYGAYYRQLNCFMRSEPATTGSSLLFVLKKLPILVVAFILAIIANVIGYFIFILPGIYLLAVIPMYYPLIVIDDLNPISGARKILELVWYNWWRTAVTLIVPVVVTVALMAVVTAIAVLLAAILHLREPILELLYVYVQLFITTLYLPISAVVISMQIYNLKLRQSAVSSH